jgi:hypothetical protein
MRLKSLISFQKRTVDWWIITFLPVLLISSVGVIWYFKKDLIQALSTFVQQALTFSFVLSSTDLALRTKIDPKDRSSRLLPLIPLIVAFVTYIIYVTLFDLDTCTLFTVAIFSIISVAITYTSILLYNNNPMSDNLEPGPSTFVDERSQQEEEDVKEFESGGDE